MMLVEQPHWKKGKKLNTKTKTKTKQRKQNAKVVSVGLWLHFVFKKGKVNHESK
jgi:hypothetical protein